MVCIVSNISGHLVEKLLAEQTQTVVPSRKWWCRFEKRLVQKGSVIISKQCQRSRFGENVFIQTQYWLSRCRAVLWSRLIIFLFDWFVWNIFFNSSVSFFVTPTYIMFRLVGPLNSSEYGKTPPKAMESGCILDICHFFYTHTFSGLKILHAKARKFATKIASRQNSVNQYWRVKFTYIFKFLCKITKYL